MNAFDTATVLIAIAALTGYINHRVLKLSATTGTLAVALGGAARPRPAGWKPTARSCLRPTDGKLQVGPMKSAIPETGELHVGLERLDDEGFIVEGAIRTIEKIVRGELPPGTREFL